MTWEAALNKEDEGLVVLALAFTRERLLPFEADRLLRSFKAVRRVTLSRRRALQKMNRKRNQERENKAWDDGCMARSPMNSCPHSSRLLRH